MGMMVMDEFFDCWTVGKVPYDYHIHFRKWAETDLRENVMRDRNHPSIIIYSAGNEIHDTANAQLAKGVLSDLLRNYHSTDPTRPVTMALVRPNATKDYTDGLADMLDVVGTNYRYKELLAAQQEKTSRRIIGTENGQDRNAWLAVRNNPTYSGEFLWTGFDYLGESKEWPVIGSAAGLFDRTNLARPIAFERQSWWSSTPMVHIARRVSSARFIPVDPGFAPLASPAGLYSDWSPTIKSPHIENVEVYSNCDTVELFLNGLSLGVQSLPTDASPRTWRVSFQNGTLSAIAKDNNKVVATDQVQTAGSASRIVLKSDSKSIGPSWDDVAYVTAEVTDAVGTVVPNATNHITFEITGPGRIAVVDNGDIRSHEPFNATERDAFSGRCVAVIKAMSASGSILITATSPGLAPCVTTIEVAPPKH